MSDPSGTPALPSTLADARLPRRVQRVLEQLLSLLSVELASDLERLLGEFEQELFRLGEQARNPALQSGYMDTLRTIRLHRNDMIPHCLVGLETALSRIGGPAPAAQAAANPALGFQKLQLVEDREADEATTLRLIAVRHESRTGLPLMLLGQRFGVLAATPAFDSERLPVGPRSLVAIFAEGSACLDVNLESRLLLYRLFDRHLAAGYPQLVEQMNLLLERENVLPGLSYVPLRPRPATRNPAANEAPRDPDDASTRPVDNGAGVGRPAAPADIEAGAGRRETRDRHSTPPPRAPRPYTAWPGEPQTEAGAPDAEQDFAHLQQLLSGRRNPSPGSPRAPAKDGDSPSQGGPGPSLATDEVLASLAALQSAPAANHPARSVSDIRQTLLAQSRQQRGEATSLSREDSDTFELLGMLYSEIGRELRHGTISKNLIARLQVPLLRLALRDHGFFDRRQHPARELLNAVAEAGGSWRSDQADPQFNLQLQSAVEHVVEHFEGDASVFETANRQLQQHVQAMTRKAEVSERRQVEAARGKEKLQVAKQHAAELIDKTLDGQTLPRFVRTLLRQAWADALTLLLLRHGAESSVWRQYQEATRQIVAVSRGAAAPEGLAGRIEHALGLVGYHDRDAEAIARRLTSRIDETHDDPASRTELALKLKANARLGDQPGPELPELPPRTKREQACYDDARTLPFGTWMEFTTNQQGDGTRRRLAWFSTVTDHALFVNERGQRVEERSLDSLARSMAQGQARVVTAERGRLIDRAWQATVARLRNIGQDAPMREVHP